MDFVRINGAPFRARTPFDTCPQHTIKAAGTKLLTKLHGTDDYVPVDTQ